MKLPRLTPHHLPFVSPFILLLPPFFIPLTMCIAISLSQAETICDRKLHLISKLDPVASDAKVASFVDILET